MTIVLLLRWPDRTPEVPLTSESACRSVGVTGP